MPDPIQFAHVVSAQDAGVTVEGHLTASVVWQIRVNSVICAPAEILASAIIPAAGDTWWRYTSLAPADLSVSYTKEAGTEDTDLRVIDARLTQSKDDPQIWTYTVNYAGTDNPVFELPEFETQATEYQEYTNYDVTGRMVENSAIDPILGGMPRDKTQKSYILTRNLAFTDWFVDAAEPYVNTVNSKPFVMCRQVDGGGNPIIKAPGTCRLKRVTEKQMVRVKGFSPATSSYYWRVSAEIVVDESTYPDIKATTNGGLAKSHHRFVTADRGFNELIGGKKFPIRVSGGQVPTEEQFLNGAGGRLTSALDATPILPSLDWFNWGGTGKIFTRHDYYSVQAGGTLTVAIPGVMGNDEVIYDTGSPPALVTRTATVVTPPSHTGGTGGSFTLNSNGSFTYTPNTSFTGGWDSFTYKVHDSRLAGARPDSDPTTVLIRVGPQPVFLAFDRYLSKDWTPIGILLENW